MVRGEVDRIEIFLRTEPLQLLQTLFVIHHATTETFAGSESLSRPDCFLRTKPCKPCQLLLTLYVSGQW